MPSIQTHRCIILSPSLMIVMMKMTMMTMSDDYDNGDGGLSLGGP